MHVLAQICSTHEPQKGPLPRRHGVEAILGDFMEPLQVSYLPPRAEGFGARDIWACLRIGTPQFWALA